MNMRQFLLPAPCIHVPQDHSSAAAVVLSGLAIGGGQGLYLHRSIGWLYVDSHQEEICREPKIVQ